MLLQFKPLRKLFTALAFLILTALAYGQTDTCGCGLLLPTAFSPNNDGANDKFRAISHCPVKRYGLHIYNRWGEVVFETTDTDEGWDGTFRDNAQPLGVYVYYAEYFNYCAQEMKKVIGNVTLIR